MFKLIFSVAVVAIHTDPLINLSGNLTYKIYQSFIYLAVPFFFTSTGFLMSSRLEQYEGSASELIYLQSQIRKYVKLYIIWTMAYSPLAAVHYLYTGMQFSEILKDALIGFFWLGENYNSYILWYLLSSIYGLLFIFVLRKMKIRYETILLVGSLISLSAVFLVDYRNGCFKDLDTDYVLLEKFSMIGARVLTSFFYLPLGINLCSKKVRVRSFLYISFLAGFVFEILSPGYGFIYELGRALATIGIVSILVGLNLKSSEKCLTLRKLSSSLYYWHLWVYTIISFMTYGVMRKGIYAFGMTIFIVVIAFSVKCVHKEYRS